MNKFQYLIIVAGLFQIISQGMDQYVIQKEQVIRNLENKIFKNNFTIEEYYNTNKTYYQIYNRLSTNSDLKLKLINNKNTDENIRKDLLRNKTIILKQFEFILSNPYININDDKIYLKYFDEIDLILNSQEEIQTQKKELLHNFRYTGLVLNDLMEFNKKIIDDNKKLQNKLKKDTETKFNFLIFGLISNILSIFFILLFFYFIYISKKKMF